MALTDLTDVKTYLDISDTDPSAGSDYDDRLNLIIPAAIAKIQDYLGGRDFSVTSFSEELDGNGSYLMYLDNYPIASVTSLVISDNTIDTTDSDVFKIYSNEGKIYYSGGFSKGYQNVEITYTTTVPDALNLIALRYIAKQYYLSTLNPALSSEKMGDYQYSLSAQETDKQLYRDLQPYRNIYMGVG